MDGPLPIAEFLALVAAMRAKQREYYDRERRTMTTLRESKSLERQVDRELEAMLSPQPSLFDRSV